jgi:hypothetical protein
MTTTSVTTPAPATTRDLSLPTALGSALLAVGSLGYIAAGALTEGGPGRAGYLHPLNAPACTLAAVGATILALVLAAWRPSGLPRWATQLAAAGMVFTAAAAWVSGTVMVGLAGTMPDDASFLAGAASAWGMAFFAPKAVLLVAFPVLAAAGWRSGALPRAACLALVLAGLLSLWPPFPPAGALTALALYLVSRRAMPS